MMLVWDQQLYDELYEATLPDGRVIHYGEEFLNLKDPPHWEQQLAALKALQIEIPAFLVGGGLSPLADMMDGTDPSPLSKPSRWPTQRKYNVAVPHPSLPKGYATVITDDVLPGLSVEEVPAFIEGVHDIGDNVIHFVTPKTDAGLHPKLTWLTMDEWETFDPDATWVNNIVLPKPVELIPNA